MDFGHRGECRKLSCDRLAPEVIVYSDPAKRKTVIHFEI